MPYYRRNLYVLSVTIFLAAVSWNQIVPFLPLFLKQLGARHNLLQWTAYVFAAQAVAGIVAAPFWGKIGDMYGRKLMIIRAGICLAGIYFGMSICNAPWQLAVLRFLNGALTGFIPGSMTLIATNTPQEEAPHSVATVQTVSSAGAIIGPAIGGWLASLAGYRGSMQIAGSAVLVSTFLVWLLVQEPNRPKSDEKTSLAQDFVVAFRSPVQSTLIVTLVFAAMFGAAINPYLTLHLKELSSKSGDWVSGMVFSLDAVAFVLTARRWTSLGAKIGFERVILMGLVGGALSATALVIPRSILGFAIVYFISGVWLATLGPAISAITCIRVDENFRGRAYGIQQSIGSIAGLTAPIAAGFLATAYGIRSIFVMVGIIFLVAAFVFRLMVARPRYWQPDLDNAESKKAPA